LLFPRAAFKDHGRRRGRAETGAAREPRTFGPVAVERRGAASHPTSFNPHRRERGRGYGQETPGSRLLAPGLGIGGERRNPEGTSSSVHFRRRRSTLAAGPDGRIREPPAGRLSMENALANHRTSPYRDSRTEERTRGSAAGPSRQICSRWTLRNRLFLGPQRGVRGGRGTRAIDLAEGASRRIRPRQEQRPFVRPRATGGWRGSPRRIPPCSRL